MKNDGYARFSCHYDLLERIPFGKKIDLFLTPNLPTFVQNDPDRSLPSSPCGPFLEMPLQEMRKEVAMGDSERT